MTTERFNIIFKDYPEYVKLSDSQNKKYIKKGKKLSITQQQRMDGNRYIWKERGTGGSKGLYLFDTDIKVNDFVIANAKKVGTERLQKINGQMFWQGNASQWTGQAIKSQLRMFFLPGIMRQLPDKIFTSSSDIYIQLEYIFYVPFDKNKMVHNQDYFNHAYPYIKVFEDILVETEVIKDDSPQFIRGGYARYVDIPAEERRLEVKIHFCKNNQRIC